MDVPLGHAIGNTLEIQEAVAVLKGDGPEDLCTVCLALATEMIALSCKLSTEKARLVAQETLRSGKAYQKFCEWITLQGGDVEYALDPNRFGSAAAKATVVAKQDGYMQACNAEMIGNAAVMLGAGRKTKDSPIDHRAGIILHKKPADRVQSGDVIATLYSEHKELLSLAVDAVSQAIVIDTPPVKPQPLIYQIIR